MPKIINIDIKKLIELYLSGKSSRELAKLYNCDQKVILRRLKKNNVEIRKSIDLTTKYTLDQLYFDSIDSPDKAYFLGFMYADGYVDKNLGRIQLCLQIKDTLILETFKSYLKSNSVIKTKTNKNSFNTKTYLNSNLTVYSRYMANSLYKKGCYRGKSLTLEFPTEEQVPKHLVHHFIRGYFDGDGCVSICKNKISINFVGTKNFLLILKNILSKECNLNEVKIKSQGNVFVLSYGGNVQCKRFYNWLYKDCGDLYLKRKKEKFEEDVVLPFVPNNTKNCSVDNCQNKQFSKSLCKIHYDQNYNKNHKRIRVKLPNGKYKSTYEVLNNKHL